jgi:superfamily II DNA or RNA helicase
MANLKTNKPKKSKELGYLGTLGTVAPAFAVKSLLGDIPRKTIEDVVELRGEAKLKKLKPPPIKSLFKKSLTGRGIRTGLAGGSIGIATAPVFLKGIQLASTEDRNKQMKGIGLIAGSGAVYSGIKGFGEGSGMAKGRGLPKPARISKGISYALGRVSFKTPAAVALGLALAAGQKKQKKDSKIPNVVHKYVRPAVYAGMSGAGLNLTNKLIDTTRTAPKGKKFNTIFKALGTRSGLRKLAPTAKAGLMGGLAGGVISAAVVDKALKAIKKKTASDNVSTPKSMKDWFKPYEHQAGSVRKILRNDGKIVMAHEMGTGKTVTSILGFEALKERGKAKGALVVVPSGLRDNYARKGIEKFLKKPNYQVVASSGEGKKQNYVRPGKVSGGKDYTIVSYAMFRRDPKGLMQRSGADTLIFDEFHKVRNEASGVFKAAREARPLARNFFGLTASLVNNQPAEIASLLSISEGKRFGSPKRFRKDFTKVVGHEEGFGGKKKKVRGLKRHGELIRFVDPKVHYVSTKSLKGKTMPKKDTKFVDVPMSDDQFKLYQMALNKLGPVKDYITRKDKSVIVKKIDPKLIFAQTSHARQIANSVHMGRKMPVEQSAKETPKVRKVLDDATSHLKNTKDGKVVLYSNLIRGGVDVLSAGLKQRGIDHALFVGKGTAVGKRKITGPVRQAGVKDFQEGKKKVIILSGAGAEGLDLPNSTAFYSLDGHFNPERILQAEARARRLGGQSHRPPNKRVVEVRRYRNVAPKSKTPGFFGKLIGRKAPRTTDEWMYATAGRKHKQNKELYDTLEKPHKYIRKYRTPSGKVRYEYPKERKGFFSRLLK